LDWIGWIGLDWIGLDLDWIGLDWIGLDWIGLDWIGLDVGHLVDSFTLQLMLLSFCDVPIFSRGRGGCGWDKAFVIRTHDQARGGGHIF